MIDKEEFEEVHSEAIENIQKYLEGANYDIPDSKRRRRFTKLILHFEEVLEGINDCIYEWDDREISWGKTEPQTKRITSHLDIKAEQRTHYGQALEALYDMEYIGKVEESDRQNTLWDLNNLDAYELLGIYHAVEDNFSPGDDLSQKIGLKKKKKTAN